MLICIMTQLSTLEASNLWLIFLDFLIVFLMLLFLVPTISLLVPKFSTMVTPSFEVLSLTSFLFIFVLIVTTLHILGHFILRPTMFPLELQVALLKPFLDFVRGNQCSTCSSVYLDFTATETYHKLHRK